ncbi:MAG TPA: NADH-quinone oxidoreductase subunit L [Mycobacteriales bacterium]|jgi:NADH-quinone oxidoreductase subunit L|nr:NADH-quinone oxidoreductase subunit L [Mycobacteriales bacterium]
MTLLAQAPAYASPTGVFHLTWLLVALPAASAAVLLLGGRRTNAWGHLLGCATPVLSFVIAVVEFFALIGRDGGQSRQLDQHLFSWVPVAGFHADANLLLDPLSLVFVLLITGVGSLIHIYSVGYMEHDPDRRRFFGELNLFVAAMLLLVLADNYLLLYVGWEGVGLASYLLIGFWSYKPSAAVAAKKAFVVNRVGDLGLSLAIMLMFTTFGSFAFADVFPAAQGAQRTTMTAVGLLLLLGACGKSAQAPLQSWLLDAMEGPTPVSALIHAATMVTAGVYLVARSGAIYNVAPDARVAVEIVGAVTLVMGAIIGCAYDDIKKVLAASTMSQIGYMMLAVGLGPGVYAIGILHLLTHGFFKANMFLGAGSVMHGMNDEVNMRRYGGLRTVMPWTFWTFGFGYLAIIGLPPFAGFFSKDKIIEAAFDKGGAEGWILGLVALIGAGVTAFYMSRLMIMTFFGNRRWAKDAHPHESPNVMLVPMAILAAGSILVGGLLVLGGALQNFLVPAVGRSVEVGAHTIAPLVLTLLTLLVVAGGVLAAWWLVARKPVPVEQPLNVTPLTWAARRSLYGDAINENVLMRPGAYLTRALVYFDGRGVDGGVNGLAALIGGTSARLRRSQTGFARSYALSMLIGAFAVTAALLLVRVG